MVSCYGSAHWLGVVPPHVRPKQVYEIERLVPVRGPENRNVLIPVVVGVVLLRVIRADELRPIHLHPDAALPGVVARMNGDPAAAWDGHYPESADSDEGFAPGFHNGRQLESEITEQLLLVPEQHRRGDVRLEIDPPVCAVHCNPVVPPRVAQRTEPELRMGDGDGPAPGGVPEVKGTGVLMPEDLGYPVSGEAAGSGGERHARGGAQGDYRRGLQPASSAAEQRVE